MDVKRYIVVLVFIIAFVIAIILSIIHYNGKYSVHFETGTNDVFLTRYVSKNKKVSIPPTPSKEGYIFKEWQLNGKKYDFSSEVTSDTILTAKWVREEYVTVTFDSTTDENIEPKKIIKGETLSDLPTLYKENYNFLGWILDDKLYNGEEIYNDITLIANFEMNKINSNYNVGNNMIIIGNYSDSAYSSIAYNSEAIGWERQILYIIEDGEFPYALGYNGEVTGYFKANAIEKKENY